MTIRRATRKPARNSPISFGSLRNSCRVASSAAAYLLASALIGQELRPLLVATMTEHYFGDLAAIGQSPAVLIAVAATIGILLLRWRMSAFLKLSDMKAANVDTH